MKRLFVALLTISVSCSALAYQIPEEQLRAQRAAKTKAINQQVRKLTSECGVAPARHILVGTAIAVLYVAPAWIAQTLLSAAVGPRKTVEIMDEFIFFPEGKDMQTLTSELLEKDKVESQKISAECQAAGKALVAEVKASAK